MNPFALIPGWDGIHPLVVDFVIVLLMLAPLFVLVSLFSKQGGRTWANAALVTMALGTLAAWIAAGSGHAAATLITRARGLAGAVGEHEAMGLLARNLATALTVLFAALALVLAKKAVPRPVDVTLRAVFLVLYAGSTLVLAQTAYRGARLVHEFGVLAVLPAPPAPTSVPAGAREDTAVPSAAGRGTHAASGSGHVPGATAKP